MEEKRGLDTRGIKPTPGEGVGEERRWITRATYGVPLPLLSVDDVPNSSTHFDMYYIATVLHYDFRTRHAVAPGI